MIGTCYTNINQVEPIFRLLSETDSLRAFAVLVWALNILSSLQSWVLRDILIDLEHSTHLRVALISVASVVGLVDTVVPFVTDDGLFEVPTDMAVINESLNFLAFIIDLLFWVEHIITLFAESHSFVLTSLTNLGLPSCHSGVVGGGLANSAHLIFFI